jgi:hypothetical protein
MRSNVSRTFIVREHHSGMFAVIDTRNGDVTNLYADEATAVRVAAKNTRFVEAAAATREAAKRGI